MAAEAGVVAGAEGAVGAHPVDSGAEEGPVEGGASGEAVARPGAGEASEEAEGSGVGVGASVGAGAGAERGYLSSRMGMGECKGFKFCVRTAAPLFLVLPLHFLRFGSFIYTFSCSVLCQTLPPLRRLALDARTQTKPLASSSRPGQRL